jgi:hypothetical protein
MLLLNAFLCPSLAQVPPTTPLRTIMEVEYVGSNYKLGSGMIGLGDVNNDGKPDFAVGAGNIGKTLIYFGGKGVLDTVPDLVVKGGGPMAKGDLNGDGKMDLIIAWRETLYVYFGKTPSPFAIDTAPNLIIPRETTGGGETWFGESFAVGDLNNDGFDDLVVGAPRYDRSRGKVYVYFGKPIFNAVPDFSEIADSLCSFYGRPIKIGDINGDGYADLCIGSLVYVNCSGFPIDSRLDVFYGKRSWAFKKNAFNRRFDKSNTGFDYIYNFSLVDVNADGLADISYSQGDSAYFFYGRSDSLRHVPDLILPNPDTSFYRSFVGPGFDVGDINGDGRNDFAMRLSPGGGGMCLKVYLGGSKPLPVAGRCKGFVSSGAFSNIVPVGDVNGDGVEDFGGGVPVNALLNPPQDGYFVIFSGDTNYVTSVLDDPLVPRQSYLYQNYPNPFNPQTTIEYTLKKKSYVVLLIYDSLGKEIAKLVDEEQPAGLQKITWNGRTSTGRIAATGVYYYRLILNGIPQETKKLLLLK